MQSLSECLKFGFSSGFSLACWDELWLAVKYLSRTRDVFRSFGLNLSFTAKYLWVNLFH